jgi:large subunit ribosomal protein LP1
MSHAELASSYAALILADDGVEITVRFNPAIPSTLLCVCLRLLIANIVIATFQADKLQTLIKAAKVEEVEPIWTSIFAKVRTE